MTTTEAAVLLVVDRFLGEYGYAPTLREIAIRCDFASRSTAHKVVHSLIEQGYLAGAPGRTLRLGDRVSQTSAEPGSHPDR